jgi:hypothetical protein
MKPALPLDKMTVAEKLEAMEQLWDDLCRAPEEVPSPAWHAEVLAEREQRLHEGKDFCVEFQWMRKPPE